MTWATEDPNDPNSDEPILETYIIAQGGNHGSTGGMQAVLEDDAFGVGTAKSRLSLQADDESGTLNLRVWRKVRRGQIVFALLVFRVEIRGYNDQDELLYTTDLPGFTFGDSASGYWYKRLKDLPGGIRYLEVNFVGNYE